VTTPLAVAAYTGTYTTRTPYLTATEYQNAPTAVDATNLVQGGTPQENAQELLSVIGRASSIADDIVYGAQGCLAATQDIDGPTRYRIHRDGRIYFPCRFRPVLSVTSIKIGPTPSTMTALTSAPDLVINPTGVLEIPFSGYYTIPGTIGIAGPLPNGQPLVQVTYINGYPNTNLATTTSAGATSVQVASAVGLYAGTNLTIYDDYPGNEMVTVASSYTYGSTTVPLTSATLFTHSAGVSVSALPPSVKQAVVHLTSHLIKTRGTLSIEMPRLEGAPTHVNTMDGQDGDYELAEYLLAPFKRTS